MEGICNKGRYNTGEGKMSEDGSADDSKPPPERRVLEALADNKAIVTNDCNKMVDQLVGQIDNAVIVEQGNEEEATLAEILLEQVVEALTTTPVAENVLVDKDEEHVKCKGDIVEEYSQAHGGVIMWDTDVNLGPPKQGKKELPATPEVQDFYNSLQYTLYETGCPETVDRTARPRPANNNHGVAIAILSAPCECMGILLEGGEQCPDGMHLVLSTSWVTKKPSTTKPGLYTLYIHKAITFHKGGVTYLDEFREPRKVTYFLNYLTKYVTSGFMKEDSGDSLERHLDCPMSTSIPLCRLVDNKVWTRSILIEADVAVPVSLNFLYRCQHLPLVNDPRMTVCWITEIPPREEVYNLVKQFVQSEYVTSKKIVVKPSGPMCFGSVGVTFHEKNAVESITDAVEKLFADLEDECCVLVETFVSPIKPRHSEMSLWSARPKQSSRVRATVCRDHDNVPVTTLISCGIASKNHPINGDNTVIQSLDTTLKAFGITDRDEREEIEAEIRNKSEKVMKKMIAYVKTLPIEKKGEILSQIDVIGIDYFLTAKTGKLRPVAIEVNGHDCTINCQIYDFLANLYQATPINANPVSSFLLQEKVPTLARYNNGPVRGRSVRPFVRTMVARSQGQVMRGKKVLVVGAGGYSKRNLWPGAAEAGIDIILVEADAEHMARDHVYKFIHFDFSDHKKDAVHAKNIINLLLKESLKVDGCLTFWEDCVPLAAIVAESLGTKHSSVSAAYNAKQKSRTQQVLYRCDGDIPHWPRTCLYAADAERIRKLEDCVPAAERIGFPAIMKLEHGSSGVGVCLLKDLTELQNKAKFIFEHLRKDADFEGIGLGFDNSLVLTEFHEGSEHDIDIIIQNRQLVGAYISDNGPTNKPYFTETAACMPSALPSDKQAQLVSAAYQCCTEIGLSNGTFNVEMKMTAAGPKLIEINARMGGFYLREWIKHLYGVDMMVLGCMVACGVRPNIPVHQPTEQLMGIMLLPTKHRQIWLNKETRTALQEMEENEELIITMFSEDLDEGSEDLEEPFGNIAVRGKNLTDAREKLLKLCEKFGISSERYDVAEFTNYF